MLHKYVLLNKMYSILIYSLLSQRQQNNAGILATQTTESASSITQIPQYGKYFFVLSHLTESSLHSTDHPA